MWYPELKLSQINRICFVMVDANYQEVAGLGANVNLFIYKSGALDFVPSTATVIELSHGWYTTLLPAVECDTIGPLAIYATGAGCIQQNLEYVVEQRNAGCIVFTYTLLNVVTLAPVANAKIWVSTDAAGHNIIWNGASDTLGVARDVENDLPCLDAGTYYFWAKKSGMIANAWPDIEVVS